MTPEECLKQVLAVPFMHDLPADIREPVATHVIELGEYARIQEGQALFVEGDRSSDIGYVLLAGTVLVRKSYAEDSENSAPAVLGEIKQFNPKDERTATVHALEDVEVLRFRWDGLYGALQPSLSKEELKLLRKALLDYAWRHVLT